ncbi:SDR family oxidoreductase [Pseudooceanicola sp.]|uniref:SDR family NAD(P)-dependent oxidoreductase n=1 Tax=Pseudooceanicola sp. TaxID=1914328 RepID=UPI00262B9C06|nr:SDR family oxidoreductase [Pseudooceanicola sp.]MDF1856731.1 SDR family oxidoreductase [Pseudooceanicola sp.]
MSNTALITGASSGIGREMARIHAARGGDLILVARREAELNALKAELEAAHGIAAHVFATDLAVEGAAVALYLTVKTAGLKVDTLINNAGFGGHGQHIERELSAELGMNDVNIRALISLTHVVARDMVATGAGRILNVGSTAGFLPGPNQAVYFASKAFVNSFSQALDEELRGKGVTCTVLTPGYVETEFAKVADMEGTMMVKAGGKSARVTAQKGYDAMMAGKLVAFDRPMLGFFLRFVTPFVPRRMLLKVSGKSQSK